MTRAKALENITRTARRANGATYPTTRRDLSEILLQAASLIIWKSYSERSAAIVAAKTALIAEWNLPDTPATMAAALRGQISARAPRQPGNR